VNEIIVVTGKARHRDILVVVGGKCIAQSLPASFYLDSERVPCFLYDVLGRSLKTMDYRYYHTKLGYLQYLDYYI
jgi:hypothetical protein